MNSATQFQLPPRDGFVVTHFLVVADQEQSRDYYRDVFGAEVLRERDPVILKLANKRRTDRATRVGAARPRSSTSSPMSHKSGTRSSAQRSATFDAST